MTPVFNNIRLVAGKCVDEDETVSKVEGINNKLVLQMHPTPIDETSLRTIYMYSISWLQNVGVLLNDDRTYEA